MRITKQAKSVYFSLLETTSERSEAYAFLDLSLKEDEFTKDMEGNKVFIYRKVVKGVETVFKVMTNPKGLVFLVKKVINDKRLKNVIIFPY